MSNKTMTKCDICGKKALYDVRTINGSWAYLCHFLHGLLRHRTRAG